MRQTTGNCWIAPRTTQIQFKCGYHKGLKNIFWGFSTPVFSYMLGTGLIFVNGYYLSSNIRMVILRKAIPSATGDGAGSLRPVMDCTCWLDYESLRRHRPDLVMVHICGHRDGRSAVDYTVNPSVGFPAVTGPKDDPRPVNHLLPAWDCITGQMAAVGAIIGDRRSTSLRDDPVERCAGGRRPFVA